jgi:hypothetical protein
LSKDRLDGDRRSKRSTQPAGRDLTGGLPANHARHGNVIKGILIVIRLGGTLMQTP